MSFQALSHRAADLYVQLELARSTVQYAAMALPASTDTSAGGVASALVSRTKVVVGKAGRLIGQEAIQLHGGIGMTAEYAVGHLTARLTAIEHTYGDTRQHVAALARSVDDHATVEVLEPSYTCYCMCMSVMERRRQLLLDQKRFDRVAAEARAVGSKCGRRDPRSHRRQVRRLGQEVRGDGEIP